MKLNKIYNQDCFKALVQLPNDSPIRHKVDVIITDPPFGIKYKSRRANYNRKQRNVLLSYKEIPQQEYPFFTLRWLGLITQTLKPSGSLFIVSGWNNLASVLTGIRYFDFDLVNLITWKYQFGLYTKRRFVSSHYTIVYACADDKLRNFYSNSRFTKKDRDEKNGSLQYQDMQDVWTINKEYWHGRIKTPNKLPSELIKKILQYSTKKGDLVLDPFLGSGQVTRVAKQMGRKFIGFEIDKKTFNFASRRMKSA